MFSTVSLQMCLYSVLIRQSVCMSSDRWGQEVPTLFEESACVQHGQLAGSSSDMCEHSASDRGGQEVPTFLNNQLDSQLACLQAVGVRKSRPFLKNQHGFSAVSMLCASSASDRGVRKSRPFLKNQHVFSMVSLQAHLQTCVNIQLQTGGVRKSRPFLNNQLNSQLARLQAVGVGKSRPFLKNQHGFSAATLQEVPTLFEESARQSVCMSASGSPDPS